MAIGDFNNNGKPDLAGSYLPGQSTDLADCAIAELQDDSTFVIKRFYPDTVEIALAATDVDSDGQLELNFKWMAQRFANIEQKTFGEYPDTLNFYTGCGNLEGRWPQKHLQTLTMTTS
ncbi:MAG: hypothetical protein H6629_21530 [Calditrichae bacterium]|nr:hypothetical protein [Calditrichia bacterium]